MYDRVSFSPLTETSSMANKDRISCLPEELIHKILSDLCPRDVAQTSSLSKQWKRFSDAFLYLNFDQQLLSLPYREFKGLVDRRLKLLERNDMIKSRLCIHQGKTNPSYIRRWVSLIAQTNIKEFDLCIIKDSEFYLSLPREIYNAKFYLSLPREIYNAKTVTVLKLSGWRIPFCDEITLFQLRKLCFESVYFEDESVLVQFFISCPLLMELGFVECHGLKNLQVSGLTQLQQLEIRCCTGLEIVEIQAQGLQSLLLSETGRNFGSDVNPLILNICSKTFETLRELTLVNSSLTGKAFKSLFSGCSNIESLVLNRCNKFYKISISSQKLRRLVMERCENVIVADILAPNLRSVKYVNCPRPFYSVGSDQLQYYTIDRSNSTQLTGSFWFDMFKNSVRKSHAANCQKIVVFPTLMFCRYDVLILEGWSSKEELQCLTKICRRAKRIIITNISFPDLAEYLFTGYVHPGTRKFLVISSAESQLYEAMKNKPECYSCVYCSSVVLSQTEMENETSSAYWQPFTAESIKNDTKDGYFYKALLEEGMTATLKATLLSVKNAAI